MPWFISEIQFETRFRLVLFWRAFDAGPASERGAGLEHSSENLSFYVRLIWTHSPLTDSGRARSQQPAVSEKRSIAMTSQETFGWERGYARFYIGLVFKPYKKVVAGIVDRR